LLLDKGVSSGDSIFIKIPSVVYEAITGAALSEHRNEAGRHACEMIEKIIRGDADRCSLLMEAFSNSPRIQSQEQL
jgi:hypothetical protein